MITILGSGPAAMLTGHLLHLAGEDDFHFISNRLKSRLGGAQYFHSPIPYITGDEPDVVVRHMHSGSASVYKGKVYGDADVPFVSWGQDRDVQAWNMIAAYDELFQKYGDRVLAVGSGLVADEEYLHTLLTMSDAVFSTVPRNVTCYQESHKFFTQKIFISDKAEFGPHSTLNQHDNYVLYNGTDLGTWYRASKLFGVYGTEWSAASVPDGPPLGESGMFVDNKPVATNCDCWQGWVFASKLVYVGRRGLWKKGILADQSFDAVQGWLQDTGRV